MASLAALGAMTNDEWIERFEADLKRRFHDRSTAKHYVSDLRLFVAAHPEPLLAVCSDDVAAFADRQRERGLSPATVKRRVAALKTFFDFLAAELREPERPNPVSLRRHAGRQPQLLPRDLSEAEVTRLLGVIGDVRDLAMVCLMLYSGLRVGEVASLRQTDISVPAEPTAPIRLRVMGKGRKERIVYLCREGYAPLARYLATDASPLAAHDDQAAVFRSSTRGSTRGSRAEGRGEGGGGLSIAAIEARVVHYGRISGVEVTCHRLRHTYGRRMAEREMPVLALSRLLGHASIQATQRYIDGADPQLRRSYEAAMAQNSSLAQGPSLPGEPSPDATMPLGELGQVAGEVASVVRAEVPFGIGTAEWLPEAPSWLREGVLGWLRHEWGRWKPSQREHHAQTRLGELRRFWQWQLERRSLASWQGWQDLTSEAILAYVDAQLERGLKLKTIKTTLDRVYEVLRFLESRQELLSLPKRPSLRLPEALPRHLEPREVLALEAEVARRERGLESGLERGLREGSLEAADRLDLALYYLLAHGGLRISEALDLQVQDLDLVGRRVRVREGKGRRDRVVYLTARATAVLGEYLPTVPHAPTDLVLSWQGLPLCYEQAWKRISCLGRTAGLKHLSPHRLRHTYATHLLNHGMSIEALRRLMGHENLNTTLIYARLADTTLEQQYRAAIETAMASSPLAQVHSV